MNVIKIHNAVSAEFGTAVASLALIMISMNISKEIRNDHIDIPGLFTQELIESFEKTLWEHLGSEEYVDALNVWRVWHDYDTRQDMQGVGGCEAKTLKQLIADLKQRTGNQ